MIYKSRNTYCCFLKLYETISVYLPLSGLPTPPWYKLSAIRYIVDLASSSHFLFILTYHIRNHHHKVLFFNS